MNLRVRFRFISLRKACFRANLMRLFALLLLTSIMISSCQTEPKNRFPTLTTAMATSASTGSAPTDELNNTTPITLRVAGPFSAETAEALRQLYLNFESGQLKRVDGVPIGDRFKPGGAIPDDVSLTILFEPISLTQMMDGSAYKAMVAAGTLPDVFVTGDIGSLAKMNAIADLTPAMKTLDTKAAARIPIFALEALRVNNKILGVPYLASVPLLLYNRNLADQLGLSVPTGRMSAADLTDILLRTTDQLQQKSRPQTVPSPVPSPFLSISAIADLRPFLKYWPSSVDATLGMAAYQKDSFRFDAPAVSETLLLLRGLDQNQMMPTLSIAKAGAVNQSAARSVFRNGQSLFLIEDSASLSDWHAQSMVPVEIIDLPQGQIAAAKARLAAPQPTAAVTLRAAASPTAAGSKTITDTAAARQAFQIAAYCVSSTTASPATAARLAMFLAQDPDALMIQSQYQLYEGYMPLIYDAAVWDRLVAKQTSGPLLRSYAQRLYNGYASPAIVLPTFEQALLDTLLSPDRFLPNASVQSAELAALNDVANARLKEGP